MRVKTTLQIRLPKGTVHNTDGTTTITRTVQVKGADIKGLEGVALNNRIANVAAAQLIGDMVVNDGSKYEVVPPAGQVAKASGKKASKPGEKKASKPGEKKASKIEASTKAKAAAPPPAPKSKPKAKAKGRAAANA